MSAAGERLLARGWSAGQRVTGLPASLFACAKLPLVLQAWSAQPDEDAVAVVTSQQRVRSRLGVP